MPCSQMESPGRALIHGSDGNRRDIVQVIASAIEAVVRAAPSSRPANVDPHAPVATDDAVISESEQGPSKQTRRPRHRRLRSDGGACEEQGTRAVQDERA